MTENPPFVSVTQTLTRINATAVVELLPENIIPETHDIILELNNDATQLEIGFVDQSNNVKEAYSMCPRAGGYHTGTNQVRRVILREHGVGRYECKWDDEIERLVVDLTTEVTET